MRTFNRRPPVWIALLLALSLLIPFPTVLQAAAALVQSKVEEGGCGAGACTVTFPGNVTTGNAVIVAATCFNNCSSTTFTASDATNGAYTKNIELIASNTLRTATLLSFRNATGGFAIVTVTPNAGTPNMYLWAYEVSGLSGGTVQTGSNDETGSSMSHNCSSSALTATGFGACSSAANNNPNYVAGASWTKLSSNTVYGFSQYRLGSISSNQGPYTDDAGINVVSVLALFPETSTSVGGCHAALNLLGVGGC